MRVLPYFVSAFDKSKFCLPTELWFLIDDEIERRCRIFEAKVERLELLLKLDFQTTWWIDCTERSFQDPDLVGGVCYFMPETDIEIPTLMIEPFYELFNPERLFRLIGAYFDR